MATASVLDVFLDGSCLDLVTLDGNVDTVNNGSFSVSGDPAVFVSGKYGQAYHTTFDTGVKMASPRVMPASFRSDASISFFVRQNANPTDDAILFLYDQSDFGAVYLSYILGLDQHQINHAGSSTGSTVISLVNGAFTHVCVEYSVANDLVSVYVNNVLAGTDTWDGDRTAVGIDECWVGGVNFGGTEYRSDCDIDQIRFFNKTLTGTEREKLLHEGTFGTVFLDRRASMQGVNTSFLDKREVEGALDNRTLFDDRRVSFHGSATLFDDIRLLNIVENITLFDDTRLSPSSTRIVLFDDKRVVLGLSYAYFLDKRSVEGLNAVTFDDVRKIHQGGGFVFADRRSVQPDLKFSQFKDIRSCETVYSATIIQRVNV